MTILLLLAALQDLGKELPRLPPTEPAAALKTFKVAEGWRIELVACEPAVVDPVDMSFDEEGRLWVVEMIDYPFEGRPQGRLKRLTDPDGDGVYDRAEVLAEGLSWPTSLCLWDGGAFVAAAPHIWWCKDGKKEVAFTGFGTKNVQALVNNLKWGPDNWIYGSGGGNGGLVRSERKAGQEVDLRGRDFRFRPAGELEPLSGGGQFGNTLDEWGRRFVCSNSVQARHVVLEDRYLKRNPYVAVSAVLASIAADGDSGPVFRTSAAEPWRVVRTRLRLAGSVPGPVEHGGAVTGYFTSATGITVHEGRLYIGDVASNLVHRKSLAPAGSTFRAERVDKGSEFLTSTDNWFRPVNFADGPDGALYVCDMYRECIEHPASLPDEIKKHLDLTSGKDRGRIWRLTKRQEEAFRQPPKSQEEAFRQEPKRQEEAFRLRLPEDLTHANAWQRRTAARLVYQRQDKSMVPALEAMGALNALDGLGALRPEAVAAALKSPEAGVRETAVRLARPEQVFDLDDPDPRVRLELAWKMGESKDPRAAPALERLRKGADKWLEAAIRISSGVRDARTVKSTGAPAAEAALTGPFEADRKKVVAAFKGALDRKGDAGRGLELFRRNCATCHKARGEGQEVGPDLATVKAKTGEELLVYILDPNREVNPQFQTWKVRTKEGVVLDGLLAGDNATTVTLKRAKGETDLILKVDIDKMAASGVSLMPEGMERAVDLQGMADLIEFVRSQ